MKVSFYKSALSNEGVEVNALDVLEGIKSGRWAKPVEYLRGLPQDKYDLEKKHLPGACFSGTFSPTRLDKNLKSYTGVIIIDLDKIGESLQDTKDRLRRHPHVLSVFTSPSNDGLKILILTDTTSDLHGSAFDYLKKDIYNHLGITLDASGRNLARLCFVSHDADIHINTNATPMPISEHVGKEVREPEPIKVNSKDPKIIKAERIARAKHKFEKGSRNQYIHYMCCCMNRLGVNFETAHEYTVSNYMSNDFPLNEFRATITSAYKNKSEYNKWDLEDIEKAPEVEYSKEEAVGFIGESIFDIMLMISKNNNLGEGPKTFIPEVDEGLNGALQRGNLYGMIGRDGTFKSIMAMYFAMENAKIGKASLYFNMQMSRLQLAQRVIQRETGGVNIMEEKKRGRMSEKTSRELADKMKDIEKNMIIVSESNIAYTGLADAIKYEVARRGNIDVQLIIIDDIGDMADENKDGGMAVIDNSRKLKDLAKQLDVAIICLSHTRNDCPKHIRNTGPFIRGGLKLTGNMDGYFSHSLLIDPSTNDSMGEDIIYREGMFYMKFVDKRGAAPEINKIIHVGENIAIDITDLNPNDFEIKLKR